jgi:uncharacterized protein (DUF1330 family)
MNRPIALGLAMLTGAVFGAAAVSGLNAQGKAPGAYVVIDISTISDPATFKTLIPIADKSMKEFNATNVVRTQKMVGLDGAAPPQRFVVISFDSMDKAKAWYDSALTKEVTGIRLKSTTSRSFIADGSVN